jgi:hypothetical protein
MFVFCVVTQCGPVYFRSQDEDSTFLLRNVGYVLTNQHNATTQKTNIDIFIAVRASDIISDLINFSWRTDLYISHLCFKFETARIFSSVLDIAKSRGVARVTDTVQQHACRVPIIRIKCNWVGTWTIVSLDVTVPPEVTASNTSRWWLFRLWGIVTFLPRPLF